jgi:hypothetical protein
MESGAAVAVKRLKDVDLPEPEFRERIAAIGAVQHELVVPLRAYYFSKDEKLLVYDYMSMGSLSALLHGKEKAQNPNHFSYSKLGDAPVRYPLSAVLSVDGSTQTAWRYSVAGVKKVHNRTVARPFHGLIRLFRLQFLPVQLRHSVCSRHDQFGSLVADLPCRAPWPGFFIGALPGQPGAPPWQGVLATYNTRTAICTLV